MKVQNEQQANDLISMLLGSADNNVKGVIVDDTILYLSELEEGYDDHNKPVIGAYMDDDYEYPIFECSINDIIATGTIHNNNVYGDNLNAYVYK